MSMDENVSALETLVRQKREELAAVEEHLKTIKNKQKVATVHLPEGKCEMCGTKMSFKKSLFIFDPKTGVDRSIPLWICDDCDSKAAAVRGTTR